MLRHVLSADSRRDAAVALALLVFSLAFHAPVVGFDFVSFDDPRILLGHPERYAADSLVSSLRAIFVEDFPREEPLPVRDTTWALEAWLFGFGNPAAHHGGNLVLGAGVVALVFLFLRRTGLARSTAGGVALAFALAPIHVEPVAWVMGRKDLLVALFSLLALLAQDASLGAVAPSRRRLAWLASLGCTALALGSKISAISLFVVLALHRGLWPRLAAGRVRRSDGRLAGPAAAASAGAAVPGQADPGSSPVGSALSRGPVPDLLARTLLPVLPHALLSIGAFLAYRSVLEDYRVLDAGHPGPFDPEHLGHVIGFAPLIAADYLERLVWPHDLSVYYRWPHVEIPLTTVERLASAGIASGLVALLGLALRRRPVVAFHLLFAGALMLPYSGLFYVGFWQADRYLYLASAGLLAAAGLGLAELASRVPVARVPIALGVAAFLVTSAGLAHQQRGVWRDSETLWRYEAARPEPSVLAFQALGRELVRQAERERDPARRASLVDEAASVVAAGLARERALGRVPSRYHVPEQVQLAGLHVLLGRLARLRGAPPEEQARHFRTAFEIAPDRSAALYAFESLLVAARRAEAPERERLAAESFDYFLHYVAYSAHDPRALADSAELLESRYASRFPGLAPRVAEARRTWFP